MTETLGVATAMLAVIATVMIALCLYQARALGQLRTQLGEVRDEVHRELGRVRHDISTLSTQVAVIGDRVPPGRTR